MRLIKKNRIYIELIISCVIIIFIDQLFVSNPGLYRFYYIIYWIMPVLFSLFYGDKWVALSLISTLISLFISLFLSYLIYQKNGFEYDIKIYIRNLPGTLALISFLLYLISLLIGRYNSKIDLLTRRVKKLSIENLHYKRTSKALEIINNEFETQLSHSQNSITALYRQMGRLNRLNSKYILDSILEGIQNFLMVRKATIWEFDEANNRLKQVSSIGYNTENIEHYKSIKDSIEGYVFRNNQFFSIRKIKDFHTLKIENAKYNLITLPININKKVWGVLNIEDLPFEKYSSYTEQILHIVINLATPPLSNALEFEYMVKNNDYDLTTGLPLFTHFFSLLEEKLENSWKEGCTLSVIIFELSNYHDLNNNHDKYELLKLYTQNVIDLFNDSSKDFVFFNYKSHNQIALISSNLDQDGISFYLVKLYRKFNEQDFILDDQKLNFNITVGYATQKQHKYSASTILNEAENLLEISKL